MLLATFPERRGSLAWKPREEAIAFKVLFYRRIECIQLHIVEGSEHFVRATRIGDDGSDLDVLSVLRRHVRRERHPCQSPGHLVQTDGLLDERIGWP